MIYATNKSEVSIVTNDTFIEPGSYIHVTFVVKNTLISKNSKSIFARTIHMKNHSSAKSVAKLSRLLITSHNMPNGARNKVTLLTLEEKFDYFLQLTMKDST